MRGKQKSSRVPVTITLDCEVLSKAKERAGLIPLSRLIEALLKREISAQAMSGHPIGDIAAMGKETAP